ncbi:LysM peptidoglycan-binding domain-containing protein [Psychromonas sp. RZ5]|nr:LysM peptidoglycan-binding domain-containing protein [Psychromonas sp. RZ5]
MIVENAFLSVNSVLSTFARFLCLAVVLPSFSVIAAEKNELENVRVWPSPDNTRVVLDLGQKPSYEIHYLTKPDRLVIDLNSTINKANLDEIVGDGPVVKDVRASSTDKAGAFRLVLDLKESSKATVFSLPPAKPYGHRLVIDLPNKQEVVVVPKSIAVAKDGRDIIVAVDAGHGGDDPGALGKYTYEKKVTLQIAKRLAAKINAQKGMQAFLIRKGDYFVNLNKRSEIARKGKADFLVSIHADGFTSSRPRGASVWVLSNRRATSELGQWMEKHEAHSELLGGAGDIIQDSDSVPFLNKMLLDMSMGNAMGVGYAIGDLVNTELSKVTHMHKKKPVHASLAVLKSPDIPSILVEAGFITNRTEERLLNQAGFQNKIANAVYKGIYKHFSDTPPQGTLFAQNKRTLKHTVARGESLSAVAKRYSISRSQLKQHNQLKSDILQIGQVLSIPTNYHAVAKAESTNSNVSTLDIKPFVTHVVKSGESLSLIAVKYNKTTTELKSYNNLRSTSLAIGQKIKIPGGGFDSFSSNASVETEVVHQVKRGEFLSLIAAKYNKTTAQLKAYNNLHSTTLTIGQKIKIPSSVPNFVAQKEINHKVKRGESLSLIAAKYNKTTAQLKSYNGLRSTTLSIGQQIKIPASGVTIAQKELMHKVQRGETLSAIAQRYKVNLATLKQYNKLRSTTLEIGQFIKVPVYSGQSFKASTPTIHKVKRGESLSVIAQRYGRTSEQFKAYNKLRSSQLAIGQQLKIPSANYIAVIKPSVHTVRSGQSLSTIAKRYGTTALQLKVHNNLRSNSLAIGQKLKIPTKKITKTQHKVRSGESLSIIAKRYGTTTSVIVSVNKLRSKSLAIGQVLTIPIS